MQKGTKGEEEIQPNTDKHTHTHTHRCGLAISFSRPCEVSYALVAADNSSKILSLSPSGWLQKERLNQYVYIFSVEYCSNKSRPSP